jgi:hypothetical protein
VSQKFFQKDDGAFVIKEEVIKKKTQLKEEEKEKSKVFCTVRTFFFLANKSHLAMIKLAIREFFEIVADFKPTSEFPVNSYIQQFNFLNNQKDSHEKTVLLVKRERCAACGANLKEG